MELVGAPSWNDSTTSWPDRGTEIAAETIAKGLLKRPLPEWQLESAELLDSGFMLLTGVRSPRFAEAVDAIRAMSSATGADSASTVGSVQR